MMRSIIIVLLTAGAASAELAVYDAAVFVADPFSEKTNTEAHFGSTLPTWLVNPRRAATDEALKASPYPGGILCVEAPQGMKLDVVLGVPGGERVFDWPRSSSRSDRLLWRDVERAEPGRTAQPMTAEHWFTQLRSGSPTLLTVGRIAEHFLLYDVRTPRPTLPTVRRAGEVYEAVPGEGQAIHDARFYPPTATADRAALLAEWDALLAAQGLPAAQRKWMIDVLGAHAFDPKQLTLVYRLDSASLDKMLPLDVTPKPDKVVRVALMIARLIDPDLSGRITQLIAQLGDERWTQREAAMKELREMGAAARAALEAAKSNPDVEVAWRAEELIDWLNRPDPEEPQKP